MFDHLTNCGLSDRMVVDGGRIRPAGKMHFKNAFQYKNRIEWSRMGKLDKVYH